MPLSMIEVLQAKPHVHLHLVPALSRPEDSALDISALSSPSLHTLDYTVHGQFFAPGKPSEYSLFRECLLKSTKLKSLTLHVKYSVASHFHRTGELNLQFERGDRFPALEDLDLSDCHSAYDMNRQHCAMWTQCMDWSNLKKLDLGHSSPQYLLPALTGRIPQLQTLRFGFWDNHEGPGASWASPSDLSIVTRFFCSITALRSLTLFSGTDAEMSQIRPHILRNCGTSLKKLHVTLLDRRGWTAPAFEDLRKYVPRLTELEVPVEMHQERKARGEYTIIAREVVSQVPGLKGLRQDWAKPDAKSIWPVKVQSILASLAHLRYLTLRIRLKYDSAQFVPDPRPGAACAINDDAARITALKLYEAFGNKAIEKVKVVFRSAEPGVVEWMYTVERKWTKEEGRYVLWVERSVEGEEREDFRRKQPFDPFG
jgi:hypothetical protein